jgi:hypothetical protein
MNTVSVRYALCGLLLDGHGFNYAMLCALCSKMGRQSVIV